MRSNRARLICLLAQQEPLLASEPGHRVLPLRRENNECGHARIMLFFDINIPVL
jgi:hypothetical protein